LASIIRFLALAGLFVGSLSITLFAQTSTVIRETEAAQHIGQDVTVEGVVTAVSTSRKGNTFINFGAVCPNQTFLPVGFPLAHH
jgi:cytochrome c-type biogenesis protein CcmE